MTCLATLSTDAWERLAALLQPHHFVRLVLTGDTRLQRSLRAIRNRHFELPNTLCDEESITSLVGALGATSLKLDAYELCAVTAEPSLLNTLTTLELFNNHDFTVELEYLDFRSLVSLCSLTIKRYLVPGTLSLPASITSLKASRFVFHSTVEAPVHDLHRLTLLADLRLKSSLPTTSFPYLSGTTFPPSLTSLDISPSDNDMLASLPRDITRLKVTTINLGALDVHHLVAVCCPNLKDLVVEGDAVVTGHVGYGLESLTITGSILPSSEHSLLETMLRLPASLGRFHLGVISGTEVAPALDLILPRIKFGDVDRLCRNVLSSLGTRKDIERCLISHLSSRLGGQERVALSYFDAIKPAVRAGSRRCDVRYIDVYELHSLLIAFGDQVAEGVVLEMLRDCQVRHKMPTYAHHTYSFTACLRALELGATNWLCGLDDCHIAPVLSCRAVRNLVELRVRSENHGLVTLGALLEANVLHALKVIDVASNRDSLDAYARVIYTHKSQVPRLELIKYYCTSFVKRVSDETRTIMTEMRLYEHNLDDFAICFLYRVSPPPPPRAH